MASASGFKHDAAGFLIGEIVEGNRDLARMQTQGIALWKDIRADMKAIRVALSAQAATTQRISRPGAVPRAPATTATRGAPTVARGAAAVVTQPRAASGRFTSSQRPAGIADSATGAGSMGGSRRMADALGRLATGLRSADNIDPAVNAAKEIKDVVSPLGRGLFSLFGRTAERKKEVWYRRFLKALTPGGRDNRPGQVAGGGGLFGGMGGGVGSAVGSGIGSAAGSLLGGMLGKGKGLLKGGGKLLRRIPILGALIAGAGALGSIFGDGTREEKFKGVGEAGGMLAGGMAGASLGAAIGTAILPGIGTAIGGFLGGVGGALLGEKFGAKVGEWTQSLMDSDIASKMLAGWETTTAFLGAAWDSMATDAKAAWAGITTKAGEWLDSAKSGLDAVTKTLSDAGNAVNGWIKEKTGVDVKQNIGEAADSVKNAAGAAWDKTKSVASAGWSAAKGYGADALDAAKAGAAAMVPNTVKRAYAAGSAAATQAKAGYDVQRSGSTNAPAPSNALQEGARSAGGAVGIGINKVLKTGAGYNVTQNGDGTVTRQDGARNWRNNNPGNIEYGEFAKKHGAIGSDGRFAIFPDYASGRAAKESLIFDGKNYKDKSLTDAISRYAPPSENNTVTYQGAVLAAAGGKNKKMSDYTPAERTAIMDAMQKVEGYKVGKSSVVPTASYGSLGVAGVSNLPSAPPTSIPSSVPTTIPKAPEIRDPAIPLNSGAGAGRGSLTVNNPDTVGQNVGDRGIAHVVSGGLGGA
jgi:hypothetical protein